MDFFGVRWAEAVQLTWPRTTTRPHKDKIRHLKLRFPRASVSVSDLAIISLFKRNSPKISMLTPYGLILISRNTLVRRRRFSWFTTLSCSNQLAALSPDAELFPGLGHKCPTAASDTLRPFFVPKMPCLFQPPSHDTGLPRKLLSDIAPTCHGSTRMQKLTHPRSSGGRSPRVRGKRDDLL